MPKPKRMGVRRKVVTYDRKLSVERIGNSTHCAMFVGLVVSLEVRSGGMDVGEVGFREHRQDRCICRY